MGLKLAGTVTADVMRSGAELSAVLFARGGAEAIPDNTSLFATVELPDDGTPCDRQNAAIVEISGGLKAKRSYGVDIPHHALGATPSIHPDKTGSLYNKVKDHQRAEDAFKRVVSDWRLNERQVEAAANSFTSATGLAVIHGPPGCGKTHTIMAIGHGLVAAGKAVSKECKRKVMVCAGSHAATDNAMESLIKYAGPNSGLQVCAFRGTRSRRTPVQKDNALLQNATRREAMSSAALGTDLLESPDGAELSQEDIDEAARQQSANDALFEYVEELAASNKAFGDASHPHVKRWKFIQSHLKDRRSPWHANANDMMRIRKALKKQSLEGDRLDKAKVLLKDLEDE